MPAGIKGELESHRAGRRNVKRSQASGDNENTLRRPRRAYRRTKAPYRGLRGPHIIRRIQMCRQHALGCNLYANLVFVG